MKKRQSKASEEGKKVDRRALVAYEEKVKDLKIRVEKLEHIVNANRKEKAMYKGAMRKLNETRKPLAYAEEVHASASNLVTSKEKKTKLMKRERNMKGKKRKKITEIKEKVRLKKKR